MVELNVKKREGLGGDREERRRNPIDTNIGVRAGQVPGLGRAENTSSKDQTPTILNPM